MSSPVKSVILGTDNMIWFIVQKIFISDAYTSNKTTYKI